jgi:Zn/Cd-binding protein ZinT
LLLLLTTSCGSTTVPPIKNQDSFFDLKAFFLSETSRLDLFDSIEKTVSINGKKETKKMGNNGISKNLSIFSDSDINRLAWKEKYTVDSITNNLGELRSLQYKAIDKNMKTQLLSVSFEDQNVDSIFILTQVIGFATNNKKEMTYIPKKGYRILSNQKTLLGATQEIFVEVRY